MVKDEAGYFKTDAGERLELIEEKNYIFEINDQMRDSIKEWISSGSVVPDNIRAKLL